MEQSLLRASQEIPRIWWNPKFYYRINTVPDTCLCPDVQYIKYCAWNVSAELLIFILWGGHIRCLGQLCPDLMKHTYVHINCFICFTVDNFAVCPDAKLLRFVRLLASVT
jgi:hypothetical protein